jgi:hypothetical protein
MTAKYRFDSAYGELYEYDTDKDAYVWVMNTDARTENEAIEEYEKYEKQNWRIETENDVKNLQDHLHYHLKFGEKNEN